MLLRTQITNSDHTQTYDLLQTIRRVHQYHRDFPTNFRIFEYGNLAERMLDMYMTPVFDRLNMIYDPMSQCYLEVDEWLRTWGVVDASFTTPRRGLIEPRLLFAPRAETDPALLGLVVQVLNEDTISSEDESDLTTVAARNLFNMRGVANSTTIDQDLAATPLALHSTIITLTRPINLFISIYEPSCIASLETYGLLYLSSSPPSSSPFSFC